RCPAESSAGTVALRAERPPHLADEPHTERRQRSGIRQGADRGAGMRMPEGESLVRRLRVRSGRNFPSCPPEVAHREVRVGTLQQPFERPQVITPWRMEQAVVGGVVEVVEIQYCAELDVLEFVDDQQGE